MGVPLLLHQSIPSLRHKLDIYNNKSTWGKRALVIMKKMKIFGGMATHEAMEVFKGELEEKLQMIHSLFN